MSGGPRAATFLALPLVLAGCVPSDPVYSIAVTNGCDHPIEVAVIDDESMLANPESVKLYLSTYRPGETATTDTPAGSHDVFIVASLADQTQVVLQTPGASSTNSGYTVTGEDFRATAP